MCDRIRTQDCPRQQTNRALGSTYFFCLQVTSGSKGLGRLWGAAAGGRRDQREFGGQMGKVMHKKFKQADKPNKQKPNPKKANAPTPDLF